MITLVLWKPESVFDTVFNKVVAKITGGKYCHAECNFTLSKKEWKDVLLGFDSKYGVISTRAKSLWARIATISEQNKDHEKLCLSFYTIWGSRMSVRLLTSTDEYIFNRLPNKEFTTSLPISFDDRELRHCLAFSIQELDKSYDAWKAATYFLPTALMNLPTAPQLPSKYFCSEFICYMFKQLGYLKDIVPEQITPNHLVDVHEQLEAEISYKHQDS
jgi:hypothetical protein